MKSELAPVIYIDDLVATFRLVGVPATYLGDGVSQIKQLAVPSWLWSAWERLNILLVPAACTVANA